MMALFALGGGAIGFGTVTVGQMIEGGAREYGADREFVRDITVSEPEFVANLAMQTISDLDRSTREKIESCRQSGRI